MLAMAAFLASAPLLSAQNDEYFVYGGIPTTGPWEIRRTVEVDGNTSNWFTGGGEYITFAEDGENLVTFVEDMRFNSLYATDPAIYFIGGSDGVYRAIDLNDDGDAWDPGEVVMYIDTRGAHGVTNTSPDGMDFDPGATNPVLFVCDDLFHTGSAQPGSGISRYEDADTNGRADDAGEMSLFVDGMGTLTVPGDQGQPVTIGLTDFEALTVLSDGTVIAFEQQDLVLYGFKDLNGDNDAMDAGEAWNYCNLIGKVAGLEQNADVVAGNIPNPSCPSQSNPAIPYGTLEGLGTSHGIGPAGEDVVWIASTASNTSCTEAAGYVFRAMDANGDGDVNDLGEVTLFLDGTNNGNMLYPVTSIYDLEADGEGCAIFQGNGPFGSSYLQDSVYRLVDLNADDNADGVGEQILTHFWEPDGCFATTLTVAPEGAFSSGNLCLPFSTFGTGGTGSSGNVPSIGLVGNPAVGSPIDITLTNGPSSQACILIVGFSDTQWGNFNLPLDLTFNGMPGNFLYVSVDLQFNTTTTPSGDAVFSGAIPGTFNQCDDIFVQWYCIDPLANAKGAITSDAGHIKVQ
ncbi:MAG: hypothetical protein DWQ01_17120 [Planctomycetota bacterium]|nr:MAG: hypothetical protein DWQ01_17120 [Planctomycetota bacterium]